MRIVTHFLDLGMSKRKKKKKEKEEQLFNRIVAAKLNWRLRSLSLARVTSLERELTPLFAGLAMRQSVLLQRDMAQVGDILHIVMLEPLLMFTLCVSFC